MDIYKHDVLDLLELMTYEHLPDRLKAVSKCVCDKRHALGNDFDIHDMYPSKQFMQTIVAQVELDIGMLMREGDSGLTPANMEGLSAEQSLMQLKTFLREQYDPSTEDLYRVIQALIVIKDQLVRTVLINDRRAERRARLDPH